MQIAVHNSDLHVVGHINNAMPGSLIMKDDELTEYLSTDAYTFDFTIDKNIPWGTPYDLHTGHTEQTNWLLTELSSGCFFSFKIGEKDYLCYVSKYTEDDNQIKVETEVAVPRILSGGTLEFESTTQSTIEDYYYQIGLFRGNDVRIGQNQLPDIRKAIKTQGEKTILARMFEIAEEFGAELQFSVKLSIDGEFDYLTVDILRAPSLEHPEWGIGRDRKDVVLRSGYELKNVTKTEDKSKIFNALRLKDKDGNAIVFKKRRKLYDSDGQVLIFVNRNSDTIYAPKSMMMYPSTFRKNDCDLWTYQDKKTDFQRVDEVSEDMIWAYACRELETSMYPSITIKADLDTQLVNEKFGGTISIGDTVYFHDRNFIGSLDFSTRISKIKRSITDDKKYELELINYKIVQTMVPDVLAQAVVDIARDQQPYILKFETPTGLIVHNGRGTIRIEARVEKNNQPVSNATIDYYVNDVPRSSGDFYEYVWSSPEESSAIVTIQARVNGDLVATQYLSIINVMDGTIGKDGAPGAPGPQGVGVASVDDYWIGVKNPNDAKDHELRRGWSRTIVYPSDEKPLVYSFTRTELTDGTHKDTAERLIYSQPSHLYTMLGRLWSEHDYLGMALNENSNKYLFVKFGNQTSNSNTYNGQLQIGFGLGSTVAQPDSYVYTDVLTSGEARYKVGNDTVYFAARTGADDSVTLVEKFTTQKYIGIGLAPDKLIWYPTEYASSLATNNQLYNTQVPMVVTSGAHGWRAFGATDQVQTSIVATPIEEITTTLKIFQTGCGFYQESEGIEGGWMSLTVWANIPKGTKIKMSILESTSGKWDKTITGKGEWHRYNVVKYIPNGCPKGSKLARFELVSYNEKLEGPSWFAGMTLLRSRIEPMSWIANPFDTDKDIKSRATQQSLEATSDNLQSQIDRTNADLIKKEEEIAGLLKISEQIANDNRETKALTETNKSMLETLESRVAGVVNDLNGKTVSWRDLHRYITISDEGLAISSPESPVKLLVSNDRIVITKGDDSFMTITSDAIRIDRGLFAETTQVGSFRTTRYKTNSGIETNAVIYIGG